MTRVESTEIPVKTTSRFQLVDVTSSIKEWLSSIRAREGLVVVYSPHTTAGILVNEAEPGLLDDIIELIKDLTKPGSNWRHNRIDNNAHAHLGQILVGNSRVIPVVGGELGLGTWQSILFLEMDGPRSRRLRLVYIGS